MLLRHTGEKAFPANQVIYWVEITNAGVAGELLFWMPIAKSEGAIWSKKYKSLEDALAEWEIV